MVRSFRHIIHQFPMKNPESKSQFPILAFTSPSLLEAKTLFTTSFIYDPKKPPLDISFYNSILKSFSWISTLQDSVFFLNHMVNTHPPFSPNRDTYHVLLTKACKSSDGSLSPVYQILNLMTKSGFSPNPYSKFVAVKTLYTSRRKGGRRAIELVKDLYHKDFPNDSYTFNFLLRHLCKNMSVRSMIDFVDNMEEVGIKPDLDVYTIMIDKACNKNAIKQVLQLARLLRMLSEEGYKPDCYIYNMIMKGYCLFSSSGGDELLGVYNKMLDRGVKPDFVTYKTLIYGLSKSGRVELAKKFSDIMVENGYLQVIDNFWVEMELKEFEQNCWCKYNTLLRGLCMAGLLEKGVELYGMMKESGMKLEAEVYGTFLKVSM